MYHSSLTHFRFLGRISSNFFVAFLENLRHNNFVLRLSDLYLLQEFFNHPGFKILTNFLYTNIIMQSKNQSKRKQMPYWKKTRLFKDDAEMIDEGYKCMFFVPCFFSQPKDTINNFSSFLICM